MAETELDRWDLFISHASEDKGGFVEPLAHAFDAFGVNVWYDDFALSLGDSLSRSIDRGLAKSNHGLVILSPAFISKKWPEYELRGLTARELVGTKVILPIWHNISLDEVLSFSPPLADKVAIKSDGLTPLQIAIKVIEIIRPEIFQKIHSRMAHYNMINSAKLKKIPTDKTRRGPIRHEKLPEDLISRIRLIRAAVLGGYTHSMDFWLDGFKRDAHPSKEILYWEHVAAVYTEYVAMAPVGLTSQQREKVFGVVFCLDKNIRATRGRKNSCPGEHLQKYHSYIDTLFLVLIFRMKRIVRKMERIFQMKI